jgi:hypothetical protein
MTKDEKQEEKHATDQFFRSLLVDEPPQWTERQGELFGRPQQQGSHRPD